MQSRVFSYQLGFFVFVLLMKNCLSDEQNNKQTLPEEIAELELRTAEEVAEGDAEESESSGDPNSRFLCSDNGCQSQEGVCRLSHFFYVCREVKNDLCSGLCSCCLPCNGTCGTNGNCRGSCNSDEEEIDGECEGHLCKCCREKEKCGSGDEGTCKATCNSNTEDVDSSETCSTSGYECCVPKSGCTANCGFLYSFTCSLPSECPWWNYQFGSCPSGCQCCGSLFG